MKTARAPAVERMMTRARAYPDRFTVTFADGKQAAVPIHDIRNDAGRRVHAALKDVRLDDLYTLVLQTEDDETIELPWDFVRHYTTDAVFATQEQERTAQGQGMLGARIRELRETQGLTQTGLAIRCGIGRVTLNRIENGDQSPRYETLKRLSAALGVSFTFLVTNQSEVSAPRRLYIAGWRHYGGEKVVAELRPGSPLALEAEPTNPYDSNAVRIATESGDMLGYVPAYYAWFVQDSLTKGPYKAAITTIGNLDPAGNRAVWFDLTLSTAPDLPSGYVSDLLECAQQVALHG